MAEHGDPPVIEVPCGANGELSFSWGFGDRLRVYSLGDTPAEEHSLTWGLPDIDWETLEELSPDFQSLQNDNEGEGPSDAFMAEYGARVVQAFGKWKERADTMERGVLHTNELQEGACCLIYLMFAMEQNNEGRLSKGLVEWYYNHMGSLGGPVPAPGGPRHSWSASQIPHFWDRVVEDAEAAPDYWDVVHRVTALGFNDVAAELLKCHSSYRAQNPSQKQAQEAQLLLDVIAVMDARPAVAKVFVAPEDAMRLEDVNTPMEFQEFLEEWKRAVEETRKDRLMHQLKRSNRQFAENMDVVMKIMLGKESVIRSSTYGWFEYLIALLHNRYTETDTRELAALARRCIEHKKLDVEDGGKRPWLRDLFMSAMCMDLPRILACLWNSKVPISPFCRLHLTAMMLKEPYVRKAWREGVPEIGLSPIEHYNLQFASSVNDEAMCIEYVSHCPHSWRHAVGAAIDRISCGREDTQLWDDMVTACGKLGIEDAVQQLHRESAMQVLHPGKVVDAIELFAKGNQWVVTNEVLHEMVNEIQEKLEASHSSPEVTLPIIADLESITSITVPETDTAQHKTVTFLKGYLELSKSLQQLSNRISGQHAPSQCDIQETAEQVRNGFLTLFQTEGAPESVQALLVLEAARLLQLPFEVFQLPDFECLAAGLADIMANPFAGKSGAGIRNDVLHDIRMRIVKAVADGQVAAMDQSQHPEHCL